VLAEFGAKARNPKKPLISLCKQRQARLLAGAETVPMSEETRKSYTIRLPERIAFWLEAGATEAGTTPTTLIQSLITGQFETSTGSAKGRLAEKPPDDRGRSASGVQPDYELGQQQRHRQLLYEIGKMRSVLLHSLDHTLSAESVDDIIEASEKAASDYVVELLGSQGARR
jgi:hypothetical protein